MNLLTFSVPQQLAPCRLIQLAERMLPEVPKGDLLKAFEKKDVKQDGVRVRKDAMAQPGACVQIYLRQLYAPMELPVLYQDARVLVVRKPAGISCQSDAKGGKTITELMGEQLRLAEPSVRDPLLCHRLDAPTQGLMMLARDEATQALLQEAFRKRQIHKQYICLVKGSPEPPQAVKTAYLHKDAQQARVYVRREMSDGALTIRTGYRVLESGDISRLHVDLYTGRTHQIRAHMAYLGHPLLGDDLYGDREFNRLNKARRLMLCAARLWCTLQGEMSYLNQFNWATEPDF